MALYLTTSLPRQVAVQSRQAIRLTLQPSYPERSTTAAASGGLIRDQLEEIAQTNDLIKGNPYVADVQLEHAAFDILAIANPHDFVRLSHHRYNRRGKRVQRSQPRQPIPNQSNTVGTLYRRISPDPATACAPVERLAPRVCLV